MQQWAITKAAMVETREKVRPGTWGQDCVLLARRCQVPSTLRICPFSKCLSRSWGLWKIRSLGSSFKGAGTSCSAVVHQVAATSEQTWNIHEFQVLPTNPCPNAYILSYRDLGHTSNYYLTCIHPFACSYACCVPLFFASIVPKGSHYTWWLHPEELNFSGSKQADIIQKGNVS